MTAPGAAGSAAIVKTQEERRADLRRMRTIATSLLVLMTLVFVATRFAPPGWIWAAYVGAFAEAAMVGACADWFAVVALFRRPLGLPIPHTAIVPENKRRIGASMGRFITNNFLSPRVAAERLKAVDIVGLSARQLADPRNAEAIAAVVGRLAPHAIAALPQDAVENLDRRHRPARGRGAAGRAARRPRAIHPLGRRGGQALLDQGLILIEGALARNHAAIVEQVRRQSSRWIPKWVDDIIAAKLLQGILGTLEDMRRPDHPWRAELEARIEALIDALAHDPEMRARGEALKREFLDNPAFANQARALWRELEEALQRELPQRAEALTGWALDGLAALSRSLEKDPLRRERLNDGLRRLLLQIVLPRRAEVGDYIAHVVDRWDTTTLVNRLELQVGRDLQYIRINGTLVGGLVGLAIYTITARARGVSARGGGGLSPIRRRPRIDDGHRHRREVELIARHKSQPPDDRGRRDQSVDFRPGVWNVERRALLGDFEVDAENPATKLSPQRTFFPRPKHLRLLCVMTGKPPNPDLNFHHCQS